LIYVTIGTGVGVGAVLHGRAVHGMMHPELGHMMLRRHPSDANFAGICPFHADCLERLAAGPAILARTGRSLMDAAADDAVLAIEADYLGQLCTMLVLSHSPQSILLGGGIMQPRLFPAVYERMRFWNECVQAEELQNPRYISPPGLGGAAGIKGALSLALVADNPS
jgi:fructokinase